MTLAGKDLEVVVSVKISVIVRELIIATRIIFR